MGEHNRHHFVAQFYLRNFARDRSEAISHGLLARRIGLFHLESGRFVDSTSIRDQAQRRKLYGEGDLESAFSEMEGAVSGIFREIIRGGPLPARESAEHETLLLYTVMQLNRTPLAAERVRLSYQETARSMAKLKPELAPIADHIVLKMSDPVQEALRSAGTVYVVGLDLWYKVLVTHADAFIASDNPVIEYNQWVESLWPHESGTGIASPGLQLFLPISPRHCIMFYDSDVYSVGGRTLNSSRVQVTPQEADAINLAQAANAHEQLFFGDSASEAYMRRLVAKASVYRNPIGDEATAIGPITDTTGTTHAYQLFSKRRLASGLRIGAVRLTRRARTFTRRSPRPIFRRPNWVAQIDEFNAHVEAGRIERYELPLFLADPEPYRRAAASAGRQASGNPGTVGLSSGVES